MRARAWLVTVATFTAILTAGGAGTATASSSAIGPAAAVSYTVCGTTSNLAGAGTDSQVEVKLIGRTLSSPFIQLDNPSRDDFEIGHTDCFPGIVLADLGPLRFLHVRFTRLSDDANHEWHLSHFTVSATGRSTEVFPCQCWFITSRTTALYVAWPTKSAGYHRDAVTGHGISDAYRDAELFAVAVGQTLCGEADEGTALAGYQYRGDRALRDVFELTCAMASYPPVAEFVALQKRLAEPSTSRRPS
jgi:hypothetical protein